MKHSLNDPTTLDRRGSDRPDDDRRGWWMRRLTPGEIIATTLSALSLGTILLSSLGWRRTSPADLSERIAGVEQRFDARVTRDERRVDTLANDLQFSIYLQCVSLKRDDPPAVPARCGDYSGTPRPR